MATIPTTEIGREVCEALGVPIENVKSISFRVQLGNIVMAEIERYVTSDELDKTEIILEKYKLIPASKNTHNETGEAMQYQEKGTLIFKDDNLRHGFTQAPNVVLKDGSLSSNAKVLYVLLLSYAWQDHECFPGQCLLAQDMGCSKDTVQRTLVELQTRKLVKVERPGQGKPNVYFIERLSDGYLPSFVDRGVSG